MRIVTALTLALIAATPFVAEGALAQSAPVQATATVSPYTADTPLEVIVADSAAKAALDKTLPNISKHPAFEQFKAMSLRQLQPYASDKISDEAVSKVDADLKALPAKP
jgi:hypothetical protein